MIDRRPALNIASVKRLVPFAILALFITCAFPVTAAETGKAKLDGLLAAIVAKTAGISKAIILFAQRVVPDRAAIIIVQSPIC